MNTVKQIQVLNKQELDAVVAPSASWHADYRDTAYIFIGGLPFDLTEGDIIAIFSQFGEPVFAKLVRDKETGKSKGFAFLKYEDQRSTDLAVDNLGGATILGRILRVDHTRYKSKDDEDGASNLALVQPKTGSNTETGQQRSRDFVSTEAAVPSFVRDHDEEDPMKDYIALRRSKRR